MDRKFTIGVVLGICGVLLFSTKAVFVKLMYQYEVGAMEVLLLRMGFALPIYSFFLALDWAEFKKVSQSDLIKIVVMGFLGYYLASYLDFKGLEYIDAGLERLILFIYPTFVVVLSKVFFNIEITKKQLLAIAITYLGVVVIFYPTVFGGVIGDSANILMGGGFIIACAFCYAMFLVWSQDLMQRIPVRLFTSIALIVSTICMIVHFSFTSDYSQMAKLPMDLYYYGVAIAVFSTVIPSYMISASINKVGASVTAILGALGPVSTIAMAYFLLEERLTSIQLLGAVIILIGVLQVKKK